MEEERVKRKEKVFEHIKYNMNSDRPGLPLLFCPSRLLLGFDVTDEGSLGCSMG